MGREHLAFHQLELLCDWCHNNHHGKPDPSIGPRKHLPYSQRATKKKTARLTPRIIKKPLKDGLTKNQWKAVQGQRGCFQLAKINEFRRMNGLEPLLTHSSIKFKASKPRKKKKVKAAKPHVSPWQRHMAVAVVNHRRKDEVWG